MNKWFCFSHDKLAGLTYNFVCFLPFLSLLFLLDGWPHVKFNIISEKESTEIKISLKENQQPKVSHGSQKN